MNVDRGQDESAGHGIDRVAYCLDRLEAADGFNGDIDWNTKVAPSLTVEELVGALVAAELDLEYYQEEVQRYAGFGPLIQDFERGWI